MLEMIWQSPCYIKKKYNFQILPFIIVEIFWQKERTAGESILSNFEQYGLKHKYLDVVVMDNARPFWRDVPYVDAIITDRESLPLDLHSSYHSENA